MEDYLNNYDSALLFDGIHIIYYCINLDKISMENFIAIENYALDNVSKSGHALFSWLYPNMLQLAICKN